jgi:hypothetical protein
VIVTLDFDVIFVIKQVSVLLLILTNLAV